MLDLSVLMPAHNSAKTIQSAVKSTLRALPPRAEIVVVDDGSRDQTASLVNSINDSRLSVISLGENQGVALALQAGLARTESRFVARMDADDYCLPWRFSLQMKAMSKYDAVFGGVLHFGVGIPRITSPVALDVEAFCLTLLMENPFSHPTFLARREAISTIGGYRTLLAEDYDLWLRLASSGAKLGRTSSPVLLYRHHPAQVTRQLNWRYRALSEPVFQKSYDEFVRSVYGVTPTWQAALASSRYDASLDRLVALVSSGARTLPYRQRANVLGRLRRMQNGWS